MSRFDNLPREKDFLQQPAVTVRTKLGNAQLASPPHRPCAAHYAGDLDMNLDDACALCGYDRRGETSRACPECGFHSVPQFRLLARNPNEPREVAVQVLLLTATLGVGVASFLILRNLLLVPAPFMVYAMILLMLLVATVGVFHLHHRRHGWTLLLQIEPDGLTFWSRRLATRRRIVPWASIRRIEVSRVRDDVFQFRLRYALSFWTMAPPPSLIFVAADNATAMVLAAVVAEQAATASSPVAEHT
jgi:hypothetical protein